MLLRLLLLGLFLVVSAPPPASPSRLLQIPRHFSRAKAERFLSTFGYLPRNVTSPASSFDLQMALLKYQAYLGLRRTGQLDSLTVGTMELARCGKVDIGKNGQPASPSRKLLKKSTITWKVVSFPASLTRSETREAIDEAFERWRRVTSLVFFEVPASEPADVAFLFASTDSKNHVVASSSQPPRGRVVLNRKTHWVYRQETTPNSLDIFPILLHEIGHILGLAHSSSPSSALFPIFEGRPSVSPDGLLPALPVEDRLALRSLHGVARASPVEKGKCPKALDSVTAVNPDSWFLFKGSQIWKIDKKKVASNPKPIPEVFPGGPQYVNATVSARDLTVLITERHLFGYTYDGDHFTLATDFPRELHDRVLFYPEAAFPLSNGSVVLLSGNVFATYDVVSNEPSFLNDVSRFFPELPEDFRSGLDAGEGHYWMFGATTASDYDFEVKKLLSTRPLNEFLKC